MAQQTAEFPKTARARTPTVLQMEMVECGAAALAIVLGYHERYVPLEELRVACGVSRDGTKASNVLKAARKYGLKAKGFSKQPESLPELPLPAIVFWNFNHFVVVEGFDGDRVWINDPASGPRSVTAEEFTRSFTGVVLVLEPGPQFEPGGQKPSMWSALAGRLQGSQGALLYVILASLGLALVGLAVPVVSKVFVDYVLVSRFQGWALPLLLGLAGAALVAAILTRLQRYYLLRLATKLTVTSSYHFMQHLLSLPMEFFAQRYGGEIGARVDTNDRVAELLSGSLAVNVLNVLMVVFYLGLMAWFDVTLTLVAIVVAALNFAALRYVARARKDVNVRLLQERGKLLGVSMSGLQTMESLKSTGGESEFFSRWAGHFAKVMGSTQRMETFSQGLGAVPTFLSTMAGVAILGVGALRVLEGEMTIGTLVAFYALVLAFMDPVVNLVSLGTELQEVEGELNRLDDVLRNEIDPGIAREDEQAAGDPPDPPKLAGHLELKGVTFGYSPLEKPLIRGFKLTMPVGARIAVVGPSASGKSTLAKVISGLYQPWSGTILLDGRPREELPRSVVANSLAMVDQDFFLYEGTVRDVLTMWDTTVPEEDVVRAAKDACIHEEIAARPRGYESLVEEGGRNFSSGQRQRLEIARSLVGNPTILVLDEATSALDPVTEKRIDENLRRRGCTCLIVAHRLSTIRDCDEIVVLDHGKVVQRGSHDRLMARRGLYRKLISTQD